MAISLVIERLCHHKFLSVVRPCENQQVKFFKPSATDELPSAAGELQSFSWEMAYISRVPLRQFYPLIQDRALY